MFHVVPGYFNTCVCVCVSFDKMAICSHAVNFMYVCVESRCYHSESQLTMKASNMRTPDEKKENLVHSHTENWLYSGSRYVDIQNGGNQIRSHAHDTHIAEFCVEPMAQQWHTASSVCIFFTDLPGKREHQTKNREKSGAEKWTHKQLIYRCEAS